MKPITVYDIEVKLLCGEAAKIGREYARGNKLAGDVISSYTLWTTNKEDKHLSNVFHKAYMTYILSKNGKRG